MSSPRVVMPPIKVKVHYGSHMPVLIRAMYRTKGPVIEIGGGYFSTFFLHWACHNTRRKLLTCESSPEFAESLSRFSNSYHTVKFVEDWDKFDFSDAWEVAFVDQKPALSRGLVLPKLTHVDYVIVHDTESKHYDKYGYTDEIMNLYKYRSQYRKSYPWTSVLSNKHGVRKFTK